MDYYTEILGKTSTNRILAFRGFLTNGPLHTQEQQMDLLKEYSAEEVKTAMFRIDSNKSPGPDGFGSGFFKAAWSIVGEDISKAVLEFFRNGKFLKQLNATNISLIPRTSAPALASQYRPISCCNVLYKCISNLICTRLKKAINHIVAENQSAFVQDRSMLYNVLICHDILRHYNRQTTPRCLMKIDLRKAYDMVSWEFVEEALQSYGFPERFVQLIRTCVSSPKYTVKVNGDGHGFFAGKRGLRPGDPMSPLLFVLVMEYLSKTLKCMSHLPDFHFHPMCKKLKLTHLVFADDLMIFCKGDIQSVARVMEALDHFSRVTGLEANLEKSNIFLAGVNDQLRDQLILKTGVTLGVFPIKYLGLPLSSKKWSKMDCHQLIERITSRITTAYSKQLSYAGRLQLINAVLFSIHSFWGAVFILPQSVLKAVDKKCRDYLWGGNEEKNKISLVAWEKLCVPKSFGGLNIKGSRMWNMASVGKLLWQLLHKRIHYG